MLADVLTGRAARYTGSRLVTRLKAMDLDVAAMGDTGPSTLDAVTGLVLAIAGIVVAAAGGYAGRVDAWSWPVLVLGVSLGGAFWGWFGVAVGLLMPHQTAALSVPLAWLLVVEPLVG